MPEKTTPEYVSMADAVRDFLKGMDAQTEDDFFPTGFRSHDQALGRFRRGSVIFVGARTSMGKTALMLNMALAQMKAGIQVYFFTLEMSRNDMIARLVSIETGIPLLDIIQQRIDDKQCREIIGAMPILSPLPGNWTEEGNLKRIGELFTRIEPKSRSIVYVDFLGLVQVSGMDAAQQYAVTTEVGLALKRAAMGLQIPAGRGTVEGDSKEQGRRQSPLP